MERPRSLFFVLLLAGLAIVSTAQNQFCELPNGAAGACINLRECPEVVLILLNPHRTQEDFERIKSIQCGFDHKNPLVCCADHSELPLSSISNSEPKVNHVTKFMKDSDILPTDCGQDVNQLSRIYGGEITELYEFPWLVLLEYHEQHGTNTIKTTNCGGVLIHKRYVLTAAHCLKGKDKLVTRKLQNVKLGDCKSITNNSTLCVNDFVTISIEEEIVHEDYDPCSRDSHNDIALLRLSQDVTFIKPVCLPRSDSIASKLWITGWGKAETRSRSGLKLKVELPLVEKSSCRETYKSIGVTLGQTQICAGGEFHKDSCQGDSGGPLMQWDREGQKWLAVGIISFGPLLCGTPDWPGVYTKVYDYVPWILAKIRV